MKETITIFKEEYEALVKDQYFLQCLIGAGVDNWQGYDDACEMFEEAYKED